MTPFDSSLHEHKPFNWYFWLANGLAIIVGSLVLYAVLFVHEEFDKINNNQDQFVASVERYLEYRKFQCSSDRFSNDNLLRKINNTTEPIAQDYVPETLVSIPRTYLHPRVGVQSVRSDVVDPLAEMLDQSRLDGLNLRVNSAYRSYLRQAEVYERNTIDDFVTKPERAARPGFSEHQLGTAVDISLYPNNGQSGYDWLQENAYRYGFVLSYPDGAQDVTEFLFEPWHWRYVGKPIAQHIHENEMLFNHEKTLLLPSPINDGVELPYEYSGRDLWVFKTLGPETELETVISGWQELEFAGDIEQLISQFNDGVINTISGSITMPMRDWIVTETSRSYTDRDGEQWVRTSMASHRDREEIERLEVLYQDNFGYMVISYQTQDSSDRLVQEFTRTCGT